MSKKRCFLTNPDGPGTFHILQIPLDLNCAPFQEQCLKTSLEKWLSLFTVKILTYSTCDLGVTMLAYQPNTAVSQEQAFERCRSFDELVTRTSPYKHPKTQHAYTPERLNSIPDFMQIFGRDFVQAHKLKLPPSNLPPGFFPYPRRHKRYSAQTVQIDALPPIFTDAQMESICRQVCEMKFDVQAQTVDIRSLWISPHGIGTKNFLEKLEMAFHNHVFTEANLPIPTQRYPDKHIVPFTPDVWLRRLAEIAEESHGDYDRIREILADIGETKDRLSSPESFFCSGSPTPHLLPEAMCLLSLPFVLSLTLADGMLRWYYSATKHQSFPRYDATEVQRWRDERHLPDHYPKPLRRGPP